METVLKILIGVLLGLTIALFMLFLGVNEGPRANIRIDERGTKRFAGCDRVFVTQGMRKLPHCVRV